MSYSNATPATERTAKLSRIEKIGFGLGDAGFNFYWAIVGSYLVFFYTDIFGISAAAAATMVTFTKIIDAFTDPAMGAIADRTESRWGKFRPYLLFGAVPMMAAGILALTTPDLDEGGKLIWAYATYCFLMLVYTILNTPYNSLSGVITANPSERNGLNSTRFFFAYFSSIVVGAATPDIAEYFGGGDRYSAKGWQWTMVLYATVASCLFVITFLTTKERVKPLETQEKTNPLTDLKDLFLCKPWIVLFILALVFMTTMTLRGNSAAYYFKYFVERPDLLGLFVGLQPAGYMLGAMSASTVAKYIDKRKLLMVLMCVVGVLSIGFKFIPKPAALGVVEISADASGSINAEELLGTAHVPGDSYQWTYDEKIFWLIKNRITIDETGPSVNAEELAGKTLSVIRTRTDQNNQSSQQDSADLPIEIMLMMVLNFIISIAIGFKPPITWAMYADVADYNEWRTGRRATGMTFSATTFSQKLGSAAGSAIILYALAAMGYKANELQSGASLDGIINMQTVVPGLFAFCTAISLLFYDLTPEKLKNIQADLSKRAEEQP